MGRKSVALTSHSPRICFFPAPHLFNRSKSELHFLTIQKVFSNEFYIILFMLKGEVENYNKIDV
jgi:hypothetical protein